MAKARKLRKQLAHEVATLRALQRSVDTSLDDGEAKALAKRIREQAGTCLRLMDAYQSSVPGRMWFYAELSCQPLRDDLRRTEMQFRAASGEWERALPG